jgi:NAD(P)-dependent dehydrogenase (short-subunit alcohol dehydrogenase family)
MGLTRETLDAHAAALRQSGATVHTCACDVTDVAGVTHAFGDASSRHGPIDVLVNNAGAAVAAPVQDITLQDWNRVLQVNLTGTLLCMQQVLPGMTAAGWGRIVNIASTAGLRGYATVASYCASKHGVIGLTRAAALEVGSRGVTVNAVCPGYVEGTRLLQTAIENVARSTGKSTDDARAMLARRSPRGTFVTAQEVADAVMWLCSPAASAVTGQAIAVAGGEVTQ